MLFLILLPTNSAMNAAIPTKQRIYLFTLLMDSVSSLAKPLRSALNYCYVNYIVYA